MAIYLVTGAAGFIGAYTASLLLLEGHTVIGVDNMNEAYDVRMKEYRLKCLVEMMKKFTFYKQDISDKSIMHQLQNEKFDAIIHLAARAGVRKSIADPRKFFSSNLTGTLNMLEICRDTGTNKFVIASTSSVYGASRSYPTPETASSSEPLQPYAASKKAAEVLCHTYHHLYGIDVSVLRYFTVYGPKGRPDLALFRFVQWIYEGRPVRLNGDGQQSRGFTYVGDIALGTISALKPVGFEIMNMGGGEVITINALIGLIEEITGKRAEVQRYPSNPGDVWTSWADTTKARKLLGWEPKVDMRAGVEQTVEWYEKERAWASDIKL